MTDLFAAAATIRLSEKIQCVIALCPKGKKTGAADVAFVCELILDVFQHHLGWCIACA